MTQARRPGPDIAALDAGVVTTTLASGLRVVTDPMPSAHSASLAVWVGVGSRDEPDEIAGSSHFLEHLAFKGTSTRSARDINRAIDAIGGDFNAYTAKESTVFMVRVPAESRHVALEVLLDVVRHPRIDAGDVDLEREVILDELSASEDNPDDVVFENLMSGLFPGHPLGREIIGTEESLRAITRDGIEAFHRRHYRAPMTVIAAAGALGHDEIVEAASAWIDPEPVDGASAPASGARLPPGAVDPTGRRAARPIEQAHMAMGWRCVPVGSPDRFAVAVLSHVLGDGPTSRLYERVREDRGLAYSIGTGVSSHVDSGTFSVHCATSPAHLEAVRTIVADTIAELIADGPTDDELLVAKGYFSGSMRVGLEDSGARMSRIGSELSSRGVITPIETTLASIAAVRPADVQRVAAAVIGAPPVVSVVGPD